MGKPIKKDHPNYKEVRKRWEEEGRPSQFDRWGHCGGAIYHVRIDKEGEPEFFQEAKEGPTVYDEETGQIEKGWDFANEKGDRIEFGADQKGQLQIRYVRFPNDG